MRADVCTYIDKDGHRTQHEVTERHGAVLVLLLALGVLALQIDQANADKNIAQAKAEERRAMAVALEQEMKAKAEEARANVIQAEAEVPKAMAEAFRSGNLGIMDYYRMKNIQADTSMRENIAKPETTFGNEPLSK